MRDVQSFPLGPARRTHMGLTSVRIEEEDNDDNDWKVLHH